MGGGWGGGGTNRCLIPLSLQRTTKPGNAHARARIPEGDEVLVPQSLAGRTTSLSRLSLFRVTKAVVTD